MIHVEVANRQTAHAVDASRLIEAVGRVMRAAEIDAASVSVAVVDDAEMHRLNRKHLAHDYPTDVLSFLLDHDEEGLEGEIVVSADTAAAAAERFGWTASDELLLYVIHGALHLVGYDDQTPEARSLMRRQERETLAHFNLAPDYDP